MDKQTIRFFFIVVISILGFSLFSKIFSTKNFQAQDTSNNRIELSEVPSIVSSSLENSKKNEEVIATTVETDVLKVKINSYGDLVFAELKKYPETLDKKAQGFKLLEDKEGDRFYVAQNGLLSEIGPDTKSGRAKFVANQAHYELLNQEQELVVDLAIKPEEQTVLKNKGLSFIKRFKFHKNSYLITVEYIITNNSSSEYKASLYGRLRRLPDKQQKGFFSGGLKTYTGAAISTPNEKYKKISFADMKEPYRIAFTGGWIAMLEHYFVSAWIPPSGVISEYQTENFKDGSFGLRFVNAAFSVAPGETKKVAAQLFVGPKLADMLKQAAPALELTVDYGVLWGLCVPLFWLLRSIFNVVGNWGWSIIFTTLFIKILFYKLSASSYRSMGNLRKLQPKIDELKTRLGADKQQFSQAVMELYRKEKVNPLGGCFPILVQIPVFISLYYVLLESVELRQAHWCLWLMDLSAKDPFYILPILMGISMFFQQKMNPPPPDPVQAKVLMFMPIFFTGLFLQFPSGLMLYWVVNNTLSILQQMFITKRVCCL